MKYKEVGSCLWEMEMQSTYIKLKTIRDDKMK